MTWRIGVVTDIHYGPDVDVRVGSAAADLLGQFTERMRKRFHPQVIVDLGDRINDTTGAADRHGLKTVRELLEAAGVPVLYAWGNHDLVNVPMPAARAILGKAMCITTIGRQEHMRKNASGFEVRSVPVPRFGNRPLATATGGNVLMIFASDPAQERAAWEWIKFLLSPAGATIWTKGTGYLPPRAALAEDPRYLKPFFDQAAPPGLRLTAFAKFS